MEPEIQMGKSLAQAHPGVPISLIKLLRPKQWTKNALVFAAPIFSLSLLHWSLFWQAIIGFFLFCFVSGCVYILNDFFDREADRNHPEKRYRPIASGAVNPYVALVFGFLLLTTSLTTAFIFNPLFSGLLLVYFLMNVAYSMKLKHIVIMDVMIIAFGFVLRAIGGGLMIDVPLTPWFLVCTMLLSLFLAISKRRHEIFLLQNEKEGHRKVLEKYSIQLLDQMSNIVTTATIMAYSLFTFTSGRTVQLMWTIPFVIYGVFRYLYLVHMEGKGGKPDKVLLEDKHILVTVVLYGISVILILLFLE